MENKKKTLLIVSFIVFITILLIVFFNCGITNTTTTTNNATTTNEDDEIVVDDEVEGDDEEENTTQSTSYENIPVNLNEIDVSEALKDQYLSSNQYDLLIQKANNQYFPQVDWIFVKAQFFQESKMNPEAQSGVGAAGIAQFMPSTWEQMRQELDIPESVSRFDARWSILTGNYYNSRLWDYWISDRPHYHRVAYVLASYNAGAGSLTEAQQICQQQQTSTNLNCNLFQPTMNQLEQVTGRHHEETEQYIQNIFVFWAVSKIY